MTWKMRMLALLVLPVAGWGQQIPFYNHKLQNPFVYNAAYTGVEDNVINTYFVRGMRFNGFSQGGVNNDFTVDGSLPNAFKEGGQEREWGRIGLQFHHYQEGLYRQFSGYLNYAYPVKLAEGHFLRLGVAIGALDSRITVSDVIVQNPNDPYLNGLMGNGAAFDMGAGLAYTWNGLRVGVSVPQVTGLNLEYSGQSAAFYRVARHYIGDASYAFKLADSALTITPHALVRFVPGAPIQYDGTLLLRYDPIKQLGIWASGTYKADYSVAINLGFDLLRSIKIGYSYEYIIGNVRNFHSGMNHEFMLGYTFHKGKRGKSEAMVVPVTDPRDQRLIDSLLRENKKKDDQIHKLLIRVVENLDNGLDTAGSAASGENIRSNGLDHLKELSQDDSPANFYTVVGAFSRKEGAEITLEKAQKNYPNARMVKNLRNDWYYIIVEEGNSFSKMYENIGGVRANGFEKAWILKYSGPPKATD